MRAPHSAVMRWMFAALTTGMMPGTIGSSMPAARARSTKAK